MNWKRDEVFDRWVMEVRGFGADGFNLGVRENDTELTRFKPGTTEAPTFLWYIERVERMPQGEEKTLEEAKAAVMAAFDALAARDLQ